MVFGVLLLVGTIRATFDEVMDSAWGETDIVVSPSRLTAWRAGHSLVLSQIEFKLLHELVRDAGTVLTRPMLIERVWGHDYVTASNIVDAHIRQLRLKLLQHGDDPIGTVRGVGYALRQPRT